MRAIFAVVTTVLAAVSLSGCGSDTTTVAPVVTTTASAGKSIVQTASDTPELSTLVELLGNASLVTVLSGPGPMTVFAPTNDAFAALAAVPTGADLANVLTYHVVGGVAALASDLKPDEILATLFVGHDLTVDLSVPGNVTIKGVGSYALVIIPNVVCTNGVVHIIDAVLLPTAPPVPVVTTTVAPGPVVTTTVAPVVTTTVAPVVTTTVAPVVTTTVAPVVTTTVAPVVTTTSAEIQIV